MSVRIHRRPKIWKEQRVVSAHHVMRHWSRDAKRPHDLVASWCFVSVARITCTEMWTEPRIKPQCTGNVCTCLTTLVSVCLQTWFSLSICPSQFLDTDLIVGNVDLEQALNLESSNISVSLRCPEYDFPLCWFRFALSFLSLYLPF